MGNARRAGDEEDLPERERSRMRRRDRDREAGDRSLMNTGQTKYWNQLGEVIRARAVRAGGAIRSRHGKDRSGS